MSSTAPSAARTSATCARAERRSGLKGNDLQDIYETDFVPGQRNLFRQPYQKRLDISIRKTFHLTEKLALQYEFNIFNVTNITSLDVPQNQTQIRQNSACSASAISEGNNCSLSDYFVNYGQIVPGNSAADQQSALTNLAKNPLPAGPESLLPFRSLCLWVLAPARPLSLSPPRDAPTTAQTLAPSQALSVGSRAVTMGIRITY
jgi:hypothetical protein